MSSLLFSPLSLRDMALRNRIMLSPMQQYMTEEGIVGHWHLTHLGGKAVGGAGLLIAESTAVSPEGRATLWDTGLYNDAQMESWKPVVQFVQEQGAKIGVQLGHFGAKASRRHPREGFGIMGVEEGGWSVISSSSQRPFRGMHEAHALTIEEIYDVQDQFVSAAMRAVEAGFDTIELHGAHGYLFHQFYSSLMNDRKDEYGGSLQNRIRMMVETAEKIRSVIPDGMPLLARISAVDYRAEDHAWNLEESVILVKALKDVGVDFVTASAGGFVYLPKEKTFPGYQVPFATYLQEQTGMPMGAVGIIENGEQAETILNKKQATAVVIGRAFLRDPHLPLTWAHQLGEEIPLPYPYARGWIRKR